MIHIIGLFSRCVPNTYKGNMNYVYIYIRINSYFQITNNYFVLILNDII